MFGRYFFFLYISYHVRIYLLCSFASCYPAEQKDLTPSFDIPNDLSKNKLSLRNYNSISNDNADVQETLAYSSPICLFNFGNNLTVDCSRFTIGDTIVTFEVNGNSTSTAFYMSLINSTSTNQNNFFQISPTTGQIFLQSIPCSGKFTENYSVSAIDAAGQSCPAQILTLTTTETCDRIGPRG